jgi:hypothetical protein
MFGKRMGIVLRVAVILMLALAPVVASGCLVAASNVGH